MIFDLAGLLATAALLVILVALELRRAGSYAGQATRPEVLGLTVSPRVVAVMWTMSLLLILPRLLGLLA